MARAADCASCHTAPGGAAFAGGYPIKSPVGTLFGSNITPDKKTGIGTWSKADFDRAVRQGVRKDGAYLYPAMPYTSYTRMTQADIDDLWAYFQTLPAVENEVPNNTLPFPLSVRTGIAVWQSLYFNPQRWQADNAKPTAWNRGNYLVNVLGHCGECHTPRTLAQGTKAGHELTGAPIEGWYAPNISGVRLSKLSGWSEEQVAVFLKSGRAPGNGQAVGPMQTVVHDSLRYLTPADLKAMAVFLKNQDPHEQVDRASGVKLSPERLKAGQVLYADQCSSCHRDNGRGTVGSVPALAGNDVVTAAEPYNVVMAILEGFAPQGGWGAMGAFGNNLSDDQIADVTNYIRVAWGNQSAPNATPWSVAKLRDDARVPSVQNKALLCPNLPQDVLAPARANSDQTLKTASRNPDMLAKLVREYRLARPKSSTAQVVEALSTAYCRTLAPDSMSSSRMAGMLVDFSQRVAVTDKSGQSAR